jgi:hypothetical protein
MLEFFPALPLLIGALLAGLTRGRLRAILMLVAPLVGAYGVWSLVPGTTVQVELLG